MVGMLSPDEIERYKRHLLLKEVGGPGQQKLKQSRVLVIGAGGLGSPLLLYLAAAGVGLIGVVDDDHVSLDNLQRQVVHGTPDIGRLKTDSADDTLHRLNPDIQIRRHATRLDRRNAVGIIGEYDIVADGSDNFDTRYLANDACYFAKRPLVTAALGPFDGQLTTFRSFETDASGIPRPTYRCLFPEPPEHGVVAPCSEAGILGAVAGVMGTLQALEVLKELLGIGDGLVGRLLVFDARACRFETIRYAWDPANPLSGETPTISSLAPTAETQETVSAAS